MRRCCALCWRMIENSCAASLPQARRLAVVLAVFTSFHLASGVARAQMARNPLPPPPVIEGFLAVEVGPNVWAIQGQVADFDPEAVEIYFGDLLEGCSVMAEPDGSFSFMFELPTGVSGYVTAVAVDALGLISNEEESFVSG